MAEEIKPIESPQEIFNMSDALNAEIPKDGYKETSNEKESVSRDVAIQEEPEKENEAPLEVIKDKKLSFIESLEEKIKSEKKVAQDQRTWARDLSRKLNSGIKVVQEYVANSFLDEEEGANLIKALEHGLPEQEEQDDSLKSLLSIANKELENIKRYSDDETLDERIDAFDRGFIYASDEEKEIIEEKLRSLKDDPVKMAKLALKMGTEYYYNVYKEVHAHGGISNLIRNYKEKIDLLEKKLDFFTDDDKHKIESEYISSKSYILPSGGGRKSETKAPKTSQDEGFRMDKLFS